MFRQMFVLKKVTKQHAKPRASHQRKVFFEKDEKSRSL